MTDNLLDHITDLEIKVAYLEASQKELDEVIYQQQKQLDMLQLQLKRLQSKLDAADNNDGRNNDLAIEKPPHY